MLYTKKIEVIKASIFIFCGKWGIRTLDTLARIPHFECGSFDHSDNFPSFIRCKGTAFFSITQAIPYFFILSFLKSAI